MKTCALQACEEEDQHGKTGSTQGPAAVLLYSASSSDELAFKDQFLGLAEQLRGTLLL